MDENKQCDKAPSPASPGDSSPSGKQPAKKVRESLRVILCRGENTPVPILSLCSEKTSVWTL